MTDAQIGILDAVAFAIALIAEVPSGALADKFGRDYMTRLGQFMVGAGLIFQGLSSSIVGILVGQIAFMIGTSFASGADEALFFEKLNFKKESKEWRKLLIRGSQIGLAASLGSYLIGGLMYGISPGSILIGTGVAFIVAVVVVWPIREYREKRSKLRIGDSVRSYKRDIAEGFVQFTKPRLRAYLPLIVAVQGLFYTCGYGMLRPVLLSRFGFDALMGGVVLMICGIVAIILQGYLHKQAEAIGEKEIFSSLALSVIIALVVSALPVGYWGLFVILLLYSGERIMYAFMSEALNKSTRNSVRATVLSFASFFKALPYVVLAPIIGILNTAGHLEYFLVGWSVLVVVALGYYLSHKKRDEVLVLLEDIG